jgi:hypothetical protein
MPEVLKDLLTPKELAAWTNALSTT